MVHHMKTKEYKINQWPGLESFPDEVTLTGLEPVFDAEWSSLVPAVNPDYRFPVDPFRLFFGFWTRKRSRKGFGLIGPTGAGKTEFLKQVFARLHIPIMLFTGKKRAYFSDMLGSREIIDGDTAYLYGPLAKALLGIGGVSFPLVIDEFDLMTPSEFAGINSVITDHRVVNDHNGGEVIRANLDTFFSVFLTGNTAGRGDESGQYIGTMRQNLATLDRFDWTYLEYLPPDEEARLVKQAEPSWSDDFVELLISLAGDIRLLHAGRYESADLGVDGIDYTLSTRNLVELRIGDD